MVTVHYLIIADGTVSEANAEYKTLADAEDIAHSMRCGVFDNEGVEFEFIGIEQA